MKKLFLIGLLLGLTGCNTIGDFGDRERLYKGGEISDVCVEEPSLCELEEIDE